MKIIVTQQAYQKLLALNKPYCHIYIKKGGCFGFHSQIILSALNTDITTHSIISNEHTQSSMIHQQNIDSHSEAMHSNPTILLEHSQNDTITHIPLHDLQIILHDTYNLDITYTLTYVDTLLKTGFEISTNTNGCCCNKSFGKKYSKQDCLG